MFRLAILALLTAILGGTLVVAGPAVAQAASYGHTGAPDRTLRDGCHNYRYHYRVKPPTNDWVLETFLVDPDGRSVSSGVFSSDSEPDSGSAAFGLCRSVTRFGRFTITGRLTTYDGWDDAVSWITPTTVRLHRRR